ncbi:bud emergence protein 1 [Gryganskiella cystojenkinii]|nr:bud emergence protein 1 [Gryganskiella cystojenkinii]
MQNLRRSLQTKNSSGGLSPNPNGGGGGGRMGPPTLAPPRKVIKALYDYNSQQNEELSFQKGDFFHVIGNEDDEDWYEACNPVSGARGYVPVTYFQILEKSHRNSNQSIEENINGNGHHQHDVDHNQQGQQQFYQQQQQQQYQPQQPQQQQQQSQHIPVVSVATAAPTSPAPAQKPKCQPLYGIVLYDFGAERPDELDAKVGDAILVIAQSNEEWYVAKPIGRLGGPGLIPVSFVEIRDMVTGKAINVQEMLRQTGTAIPRVEEWKKQAMEYKANSIPLGRIDSNEAQQQQQQQIQQQPQPQQQFQQQQTLPPQQQQQYHPHQSMGMPSPQLPIHPQQFANQNSGPTIQQLKNKMSRDLKSQQQQQRDPLRRLPSHEDMRRLNGRDDISRGSSTPISSRIDGYDHSDHGGDLDSSAQLVYASVDSYHHEDDQYWFTVKTEMSNGAHRNLLRLYEDFYNFHIALLEEFPVESGRVGDQPRILPFMPMPLQVVNDSVSASRRVDLNEYVQDLCRLPRRILHHPLVEQLFSVRDGDSETSANSNGFNNSGNGSMSGSSMLGRSTPSSPMFHSSALSDRRPSHSAGPRAMYASKSLQQGASTGSYRSYGDEPGSAGGSPSLRSQSSFQSSAINLPGSSSNEEMIKIKISFQDDIMAMRIPVSISFRSLQQKVFERLNSDPDKELSYRDDRGDFAQLQNDSDVRDAIDRSGGKLMIYVD